MTPNPLTQRVRRRRSAMLWAFLHFNARKFPKVEREASCWLFLLVWASLGGTRDEVPA